MLARSRLPIRALRSLSLLILFLTLSTLLIGRTAGQNEQPPIYLPVAAHTLFTPAPSLGIPQFGINFITSAEEQADARKFQNGRATGAAWDRWPLYWFNIEQSQGVFNWSNQDIAIQGDVAHGFKLNAILLGTPPFYTSAPITLRDAQPPPGQLELRAPQRATPQGLYEPVFSDGTDQPGPGKSINSANRWAVFADAAVNRYKPGGVLARANGWAPGVGVTHWEMWNEPDLTIFWDGTLADYARLLKVGYLAAKHADPGAVVLFGGLAYFAWPTFYNEVLAIYAADPLAASQKYFHDVMVVHNYSNSWESWYHVWKASQAMAAYGLDKPIWINESGVPAWDDYPGPLWDPNSAFRASMAEQANFIIQSAFYAVFAGADAYFHFQLYDACGNQPAGTDFPPHHGELCTADGKLVYDTRFPCAGDANGLFSNPTDAVCFRQHPRPETPRPNYNAFRVLTAHLRDVYPTWRQRPGGADPANGPQEWIAFYRPTTSERIIGLWARFGTDQVARVRATHTSATLVRPDGTTQTITPVNGYYELHLPRAIGHTWAYYPIGGQPFILIEHDAYPPDPYTP